VLFCVLFLFLFASAFALSEQFTKKLSPEEAGKAIPYEDPKGE
jgi:hypothetical protein